MAAQQTAVANLSALLKKTSHYDKDERYMATSDLCEVLKRHQQQQQSAAAALAGGVAADHPAAGVGGAVAAAVVAAATPPFWDAATERQICTAVLRLLHDKSNDVQAIAVKTLSVLLTTVQQEQVIEIADSLADQVLDSNKSELRDVYAIGLRTLIKTIPAAHGNAVSQRLVTRLIDGCALKVEDITLVCLDALTDLLSRFGLSAAVVRQHDVVLQVCLRELSSSEFAVVRKRAGTALSCLAVVLSDTLLHRMVENILSTMESSDPTSDTVPALIRTMCGVSGAVGHRLGQDQIDRIVPIFLKHTPTAALASMEESSNTIAANELRESCFMGFESFVLRCPRQIEPHLESMVLASLAYMSYDPNYSYDDDGGGGDDSEEDEDAMSQDDGNEDHEMQDDEEEDDYHEEDDDEDDDDDDESWKVRRSAIKAIRGVVESHRHDPSDMWTRPYAVATTEQQPSASVTVATALVRRFKEREENCRVGVVECFNRLLTVTIQAQQHQPSSRAATGGEDDVVMSSGDSNDGDVGGADDVIPIVRATAPKVVRACQKILALRGNERSKSAALALLSTLCCAPGGFGGPAQISKVFGHVKSFLQQVDGGVAPPPAGAVSTHHLAGGSKALRLDALSLIHAVLVSPNHNPEHVRQNLPLLLPALCGAVQEQWYKVIAEALRAIAAVPKFYDDGSGSTHPEVASRLYGAVAPLLAANDVDQEIKECALKACASILSSLPSSLTKDESTHLLRLLLERLQNETTRVAAMKTLSQVATSRVVDVSPILADAIATLAGFLKLAGRTLQQSSLEALDTLIVHHGALAELQGGELYSSVLRDFAGLVVDSDLHLSHLSLRAAVSILQVCPNAGPAVKAHILEPALILSTSPLLQDPALGSLVSFFRQTIASHAVDFAELRFLLNQRANDKISKHALYNLAKCVSVVSMVDEANSDAVLGELCSMLEGTGASPVETDKMRQLHLALLITGNLGRMMDLSANQGMAERLKKIYLSYFESSSDDLKQAAAYALGNASVGSQSTFLPAIVAKLDDDNKKMQYLLLSALREFIQCSCRQKDSCDITASIATIIAPLERHCSDEEEGVRTMVAECIGSLASLYPEVILPKLATIVNDHLAIDAPNGIVAEDDVESRKNALVCWTIATSIKLALASKADPVKMAQYMPCFVKLIEQKDINVRNAALLMVYSAVHHSPRAVASLLRESVVPFLYEVSELKMERKVDLGPFTHRVDDALPLRKAALSIFATCLEHLPNSIDIASFMPVLTKALGDAEDVQLHAHQIVITMCTRNPSYIIASVDAFLEPLDKTLNKKPGQKTGTELERLNDWIKSALRVTVTLAKVEGIMNSRLFSEFLGRVRSNSRFATMLEKLEDS